MPTPPGPMGTNAPAEFVRNAVRTRPTPVETAPSGHVSAVALGIAKDRIPSSARINPILILHILVPFPLHIVFFLSRCSHLFDVQFHSPTQQTPFLLSVSVCHFPRACFFTSTLAVSRRSL